MVQVHPVPPGASCNLAYVSRPRPIGQQSFDSLAAMMQAYAEEAVRVAAEDHGMVLDYSSASLGPLETVLAARTHLPEPDQDEATRLWGAYFGEIFRRRYPCEWTMAVYPGGELAIPALEIEGSHIFPLLKIFRRLTIGPAEDLKEFYGKVTTALDARSAKH